MKRLPRTSPWLLALTIALGASSAPAGAQDSEGEITEPVDRVLAVVDEDPILQSELEQIVALGLAAREEDEEEVAFRRRVLDQLIAQKLRFHEIDRYGFAQVPLEEVEEQFEAMRKGMGGATAMARELERLGLDEQGVRQLLARQLMVLIYVEERLGPRVLIGLEDIQTYYDQELVPRLRANRQTPPPIAEVREQIRQLLREQRLNEEIERWTEELRLEADVEDYFDSEHDQLPARVVERVEAQSP